MAGQVSSEAVLRSQYMSHMQFIHASYLHIDEEVQSLAGRSVEYTVLLPILGKF